VEENDCDKLTILQRYGVNYGCKKFYGADSRATTACLEMRQAGEKENIKNLNDQLFERNKSKF
jgi:hypothetical protein